MNIDAFFYLEKVRKLASHFPGVTEKPCYGTPGFYAGTKLFARLREEGDVLVVYCEHRDAWMAKQPGTFFITDHYKDVPYVLVSLKLVKEADLLSILEAAWRARIGKKLLAEWLGNHQKPAANK